MKEVTTRDGSTTFFNEKVGDYYHSHTIGAIEESTVKYVEPCNIKGNMRILDVCFGLGYNTLAALKFSKKLNIICLEKDENIINMIQNIEVPDDFKEDYKIIQELAKNKTYDKDGLKITLIIGDARETIKPLNNFDAVFFDPFAPQKVPELWSKEFFKDIYDRMNKGARLSTYSCATFVRKNMTAAGFKVIDGPIFGRKSPSTVAVKE